MNIDALTDPRKAHKLSEFLAAGINDDANNYHKFSFREHYKGLEFVVKNILDDYLYELKQMSMLCILTEDEYLKYKYNPKRLSSDIYGTTEVYFIILAINDICNIRDFNMKSLMLLKRNDMAERISEIYSANKYSLDMYNKDHDFT